MIWLHIFFHIQNFTIFICHNNIDILEHEESMNTITIWKTVNRRLFLFFKRHSNEFFYKCIAVFDGNIFLIYLYMHIFHLKLSYHNKNKLTNVEKKYNMLIEDSNREVLYENESKRTSFSRVSTYYCCN